MWLMTRYGFFSIVCAHAPEGGPSDELMMVRARHPAHLNALRREYPHLGPVRHTTATDYPCRVIAPRPVVCAMVCRLACEVDYMNFKGEVHAARPDDAGYAQFLHDVWARGIAMSPPGRGGLYQGTVTGRYVSRVLPPGAMDDRARNAQRPPKRNVAMTPKPEGKAEFLEMDFRDVEDRVFVDYQPGPYYVTAVDGPRVAYLAGPFATHREALDTVPGARDAAIEADCRLHFASFGTARMKDPAARGYGEPGRLNERLGVVPTFANPVHTGEGLFCLACGVGVAPGHGLTGPVCPVCQEKGRRFVTERDKANKQGKKKGGK